NVLHTIKISQHPTTWLIKPKKHIAHNGNLVVFSKPNVQVSFNSLGPSPKLYMMFPPNRNILPMKCKKTKSTILKTNIKKRTFLFRPPMDLIFLKI
ncbi:MAG: hypothetical protein P8M17_10295, partial [Saprospiraceae bacterium]|nr:hypothetical protein [Saprospiraceae bacterium]